jgi:hypothetical protein
MVRGRGEGTHLPHGVSIVVDLMAVLTNDCALRKSVRKYPGSTTVAWIPSGASSMDSASVQQAPSGGRLRAAVGRPETVVSEH